VLSRRVAWVPLALFAATGVFWAQPGAALDLEKVELMLSRGTTANAVSVDANLSGIPSTRQEVRALQVFPIEANTAVLVFTGSGPPYDAVQRPVVLTEDGLWGIAPLTSAAGRAYFLSEVELRMIAEDFRLQRRTWVIVKNDFATAGGRVAFTRGEVFPIDTIHYAAAVALFDRTVPLTASKYDAVSAELVRNGASPSITADGTHYAVLLGADYTANLDYVDAPKVIDYLQQVDLRQERRSFWSSGAEPDPVFKQWRKAVWLREPYRVSCNDEIIERRSRVSQLSGKLDAKFGLPDFLKSLGNLGFSVDAEMSTVQSWTSNVEQVTTTEGVSFDTDSYLFGTNADPIILSFGNAAKCPPPGGDVDTKFFTATIPGRAETAVNASDMEALDELDESIVWRKRAGYLQVSCLRAGYAKVIDYLVDELGLEPSMARLFAANMVKVKLEGFLAC
jgi:hypothetical protein